MAGRGRVWPLAIIVMRCCRLWGWQPGTDAEAFQVTEDLAFGWGNARRADGLASERLSCSGSTRMGDHCARAQLPHSISVYKIHRCGQQVPKASWVKSQAPSKGKEDSQTVRSGSGGHSP